MISPSSIQKIKNEIENDLKFNNNYYAIPRNRCPFIQFIIDMVMLIFIFASLFLFAYVLFK